MKLRVVLRNIVHYVRTDLKEIAFPSSLPDPPSAKPKPRKLTLQEHLQVWKTATKLYVRSWRTGTIDDEDTPKTTKDKAPDDLSAVEELALAARAGADNLRPALHRIYISRVSAYRDALKSFVVGYREGIAEVMDSKPFQGFKDQGFSGEQDGGSGNYTHQNSTSHQEPVDENLKEKRSE